MLMETGIVAGISIFRSPNFNNYPKIHHPPTPLFYSLLEVSNRSSFPQRFPNFYDSTVACLLTCLVVKSWGMDILYSLLVLRLQRFHKNPPGTSHSENLWCCVGNSGDKQYEKKTSMDINFSSINKKIIKSYRHKRIAHKGWNR